MSPTSDVEIQLGDGWDNLSKLEQADRLFLPFGTQVVAICLEAIKEQSQPYPMQPARDRAKTFNTYVRGRGRYPKSAFVAAATEPGGFRVKRTKQAAIKMTSQQLDKRFHMRVQIEGDAIVGRLTNTADYSGYVIGSENQDSVVHQVPWHKETGWVGKETAIDRAKPQMDRAADTAIEQFVAALAGKG